MKPEYKKTDHQFVLLPLKAKPGTTSSWEALRCENIMSVLRYVGNQTINWLPSEFCTVMQTSCTHHRQDKSHYITHFSHREWSARIRLGVQESCIHFYNKAPVKRKKDWPHRPHKKNLTNISPHLHAHIFLVKPGASIVQNNGNKCLLVWNRKCVPTPLFTSQRLRIPHNVGTWLTK